MHLSPKHTIQGSLARRAEFISLVFLKLRLPAHLGRHSTSQAFQAKNLPSFSFGFHRNLLVKESSLSQIFLGILKEERV